MKTLGLRYDENRFRHFDEFVQRLPSAQSESLSSLLVRYRPNDQLLAFLEGL